MSRSLDRDLAWFARREGNVRTVEETRDIAAAPVVDLAARTIVGVVVPYNVPSNVLVRPGLGKFRERILSGAFDASLGSDDVYMYWQHEERSLLPLGRTMSNLELRSTKRALEYTAVLPNTTLANDLLELMADWYDADGKRHAPIVPGRMSFNFLPQPVDSWRGGIGEVRERDIRTATLRSISIVRDPAYLQTEALLRPDAARKWAERSTALRQTQRT